MLNLNKALKNAQIYSIEYCGFYILKFSISPDLDFSENFDDISLAFISGIEFSALDENSSGNLSYNLYGIRVTNAIVTNENDIELYLSSGDKITSLKDKNELVDRDWLFSETNDKNNYILSDKGNLYYSESMKILID